MADYWKAFERRVAKFIGGTRLNAKGEAVTDVAREDGLIVAECKARQDLPAWICHGFDQLAPYTAPIKFIALHSKGESGFYVLIRSNDFKRLVDCYLERHAQPGREPDSSG